MVGFFLVYNSHVYINKTFSGVLSLKLFNNKLTKTKFMKKLLFILLAITLTNCSKEETIDITTFNAELSVLENLNNGVAVLDIVNEVGVEAFYGIEYQGGYVFHVDETNGNLMIATDYSEIGPTSWGDHFDLTNSATIGSGLDNTQQIVDGNLNDNSNVPNGLEFGSDNYAFKIAIDLDYLNYNDWFIPSSGSMQAIFENVHSKGLGNFDENLFYWTSTKDGYQPYVMSFNANFFNGNPFLGTCFASNALLIVRKVES